MASVHRKEWIERYTFIGDSQNAYDGAKLAAEVGGYAIVNDCPSEFRFVAERDIGNSLAEMMRSKPDEE